MADAAQCHAYLFEAKGIQRYILASGKLRDLIGASDMVAALASGAGDAIGAVLDKIGWGDNPPMFSRRAGGAFCLHSNDRAALVRLRVQWRMHVMTRLPGLEFSDAFGAGASEIAAMRDCFLNGSGIRSNMIAEVLPLGRPVNEVAPLTGRPAVAVKRYRKDEGNTVLVDVVVLSQRNHADRTQKSERVGKRFVPAGTAAVFPRNFDPDDEGDDPDNPLFPFRKDADGHIIDRRFAVIHADLSGLGELFRKMGHPFTAAKQNLDLGASIETAIHDAAATASATLKFGCDGNLYPARPILLGGDDITILVRADLAVPYTIALLKAIETTCESIGGADALSACAGVAIVGPGTPFATAYHLADTLCSHAKKAAKGGGKQTLPDNAARTAYPSAFAFHVQQQTALENYGDDVMPTTLDKARTSLSGNPFFVGRFGGAVGARLLTLAKALGAMEGGHGRVRTLRALAAADLGQAESEWKRWWTWGLRRQKPKMDALAAALGIAADSYSDRKLPNFPPSDCGLYDAMALVDLHAHDVRVA